MDKVEVSLEKAMGTLTPKEGAALKPKLMRKAIKDTGFTLTWMKVKARGEVAEANGSSTFKVAGSGQTFMLLDNDVLAKLRADPALAGKEILVIGSVEQDDPVALRLESFEVE